MFCTLKPWLRPRAVLVYWCAHSPCFKILPCLQEIHEGLEFCDDDEYNFGIFSVKFSKDGREVVVGNNDSSIYVYDLGANKVSVRIRAHSVWNNSIGHTCFGSIISLTAFYSLFYSSSCCLSCLIHKNMVVVHRRTDSLKSNHHQLKFVNRTAISQSLAS